MNRWARIVLALAALATLGWVLAGASGWSVADDATLARHTLLSYLVLLALILTHGWVAVFAVASNRLVARRATLPGTARRELSRARLAAFAAACSAVAATLAQFLISNALYPARLVARPHAIAGWATTGILVLAWIAERRALTRHGRALAALEN